MWWAMGDIGPEDDVYDLIAIHPLRRDLVEVKMGAWSKGDTMGEQTSIEACNKHNQHQ